MISPAQEADDGGRMEKVTVVGQGYVGLPVAVRAVEVGFDVVGFDVDQDKVKQLAAGESHVEDISNERLTAALASGRYRPTTAIADAAGFDYAVMSVPTPLRDGSPNLSYIEEAARALGQCLRVGATVILESTTYPGTTEELVGPLLKEASGLVAGRDFHLGYSPERIDPGNRRWRFENTPKVVSGIDAASLAKVQGFFDRLVEQTVAVSSPKEAELSKLLENTFRHVNIALVNELAMFASDLGIDVWEAIDAASTKPFGYMRFTPGPGVGGHCLPIDPSYLSWQVRRSVGQAFRFVELANDVNEHMPDYVVRRLVVGLNHRAKSVKGSRILLLGLSYKKNTGDARESPSHVLVRQLQNLGAHVRAADPHVSEMHAPSDLPRVELTPDELVAADAVVLVVDHDEFDLDAVVAHSRYVFDCRGVLPVTDHVERL
jgi:UDP-N-acetyl-D-glucosamine dehydrogenase